MYVHTHIKLICYTTFQYTYHKNYCMLNLLCTLPADRPAQLHRPKARIANLTSLANDLLQERLAPSIRQTFTAGQQKFYYFCSSMKCTPMPSTETTLVLFASHSTDCNISHNTIKVYLAATRQLHVSAGLHELFSHQLTPRLQQVLRGIKKCQDIS